MYARESGGTIELFFYDSNGTARVFWTGDQEASPVLAPIISAKRSADDERPPNVELAPQATFSLQELLRNAEMDGGAIEMPPIPAEPVLEPPVRPLPPVPVEDALSEATRRRAAKASVRKAVAHVMKLTTEQQFKYEQALLVKNKNIDAMSEMKMVAAIEGVTVEEWARGYAAEHEARRRRGGHVWALEAQALKDIDKARGDDIEAVASDACLEIIGDDEC